MLDHFDTILQSSTFRSYEKSFVERLLASLYIFVLVGIFGGVTIRLILGSLPMERFIGSLGICAIAVVGLGFLRWGKAYISALVLVVGMWIAVTVISVRGDGVFDPGFGAYTLLVFISGFLLIPRTALICAGFSVAGGLLILGSTPAMPTGSAASIWISESLYVIAAGVLVVVVSSSIRSAQERSREDREALIENNRRLEQQRIEADRLTDEVRDLNANLEKLVQDRTQALEQEMAERRRTEARYRAIVESQTDLVCRYLPDTTLTFSNEAHAAWYNRRPEEMVGVSFIDLIHPDEREEMRGIVADLVANPRLRITERKVVDHDGPSRWLRWVDQPIFDESGSLVEIQAVGYDITDHKEAEAELNRSETLYRILARNLPDMAVLLFDRDLRYLVAEGTALIRAGYSSAQMEGRTIWEVLPQEQAARLAPDYQRVFEGEVITREHHRPDGISFELTFIPISGEDDAVEMGLLVALDVTNRKRNLAKISELNETLARRAAELQTAIRDLESFSYSVSHDLRAPLRAMIGFSNVLRDNYGSGLDEKGSHYLNRIQSNALHMGELIDDLLQLSRLGRQQVRRQLVQPAEIAQEALEMIGDDGSRDAVVISEMPACEADLGLLRQVYSNLIANALKFTKGRETPQIEAGCNVVDGETVYYVRDNGVGFDMAYADKLFGVFQRLHSRDEFDGTGVGLAIVHRIIMRHGGRVWAEAAIDEGATFYFTLGENEKEPAHERTGG